MHLYVGMYVSVRSVIAGLCVCALARLCERACACLCACVVHACVNACARKTRTYVPTCISVRKRARVCDCACWGRINAANTGSAQVCGRAGTCANICTRARACARAKARAYDKHTSTGHCPVYRWSACAACCHRGVPPVCHGTRRYATVPRLVPLGMRTQHPCTHAHADAPRERTCTMLS